MERFIPSNVVKIQIYLLGNVIQYLKDGTKRTTNYRTKIVTIHDKDGNLIYEEKLSEDHPLIRQATEYYLSNVVLKIPYKNNSEINRMRRRGKWPPKYECEEYFKITI